MKDRGHLLEKRKKMAGIWLAAPALLGTFLFFFLPFFPFTPLHFEKGKRDVP